MKSTTTEPAAMVKVLDGALQTREARSFVARVREVATELMQEGIHYGVIPGVKKRSLWQPGAEVLGVAFRLAPSYEVDDRSVVPPVGFDPREATYRYAVTCRLTHAPSGLVVAEGLGEASTDELKYRWREPATRGEYAATPEEYRGKKWSRWGKYGPPRWKVEAGIVDDLDEGRGYSVLQVRTVPADLANTVRKMAAKRAHVGAVRSATAASDTFSEGLEELREAGVEPEEGNGQEERGGQGGGRAPVAEPRATTPPAAKNGNGATNGRANGGASNGRATFDAEAAERVGASIPPEEWEKARSGWHDRGAISESQLRMILAVAAQTHAECHEKKCPTCKRAGQALPVRKAWDFNAVRNLVGVQLDCALEEIPWGDTKDAVVRIFETYAPAGD